MQDAAGENLDKEEKKKKKCGALLLQQCVLCFTGQVHRCRGVYAYNGGLLEYD